MTLTDNLVSYWKFDESSGNAADSIGSNTLTNTGITYVAGKINNGAFNNSNTDTLYCADNASLSLTGAHSVSYWIKFDTIDLTNGEYMLLFYKQGGSQYGYSQVFANNGTGATRRFIYTLSKTENGSEQSALDYDWSAVQANTWYHIVWTYTPSTNIKLYINGSNVSTYTTSVISSIFDNIQNFNLNSIGTDAGTRTMDEVGIWSRALSSTEVTELYNGGNGLAYPFIQSLTNASFLLSMI